MSITAWEITAHSYKDNDYGYVSISTTWPGRDMPLKPVHNKKTEAMWSHESLYGVIGSKIGDFIEHYGVNSSLQEGIFTHRKIAIELIGIFSGLKMNEIDWKENPLEKKLNSGKLRVKRAKWLPEKEVDIVHLYSDVYINVSSPSQITTDFFTAIRQAVGYEHNWLMCTKQAAERLKEMNFENLEIKETRIVG